MPIDISLYIPVLKRNHPFGSADLSCVFINLRVKGEKGRFLGRTRPYFCMVQLGVRWDGRSNNGMTIRRKSAGPLLQERIDGVKYERCSGFAIVNKIRAA